MSHSMISNTSAPLLLVLSAPSGAGKTTLARRLLSDVPNTLFSVSYTTRAPRGKEVDKVDYCFVNAETFQRKIDNGDFVEWAQVHDHFYGSPRSVVDEAQASQGVAVFDIDVQGGLAIKSQYPEAILVFILPPSLEELERRLRERATDSDDTIRRRLLAARSEMSKGVSTYDYLLINDNIESSFSDLKSILKAERLRKGRVSVASLRL
jgi:guanylate kinase